MRTNQEVKTVFAVYQCISYPEEGLWSAKGLWTRRWESCGCKKMVREKEGWLSGYGNSQSKVMECVRLKGEEAGWEVNENWSRIWQRLPVFNSTALIFMEVISLLLQNAKLCCGNPTETQQRAWPLVDRLRDNEWGIGCYGPEVNQIETFTLGFLGHVKVMAKLEQKNKMLKMELWENGLPLWLSW